MGAIRRRSLLLRVDDLLSSELNVLEFIFKVLLTEVRFVFRYSLEHECNLSVLQDLSRGEERCGCRCKRFLGDEVSTVRREGLEEEEGRLTVGELDLQEVLQLDHEMLVLRERLEGVHPILYRKEGLLVGINLGKELLFEHIRQVESSQGVVLVHEGDKFDEVDLVRLARCVVEGLFNTVIDL